MNRNITIKLLNALEKGSRGNKHISMKEYIKNYTKIKAQQLYQAGKYHEAITEFQNAISLQEEEEREGLYNIGCCY